MSDHRNLPRHKWIADPSKDGDDYELCKYCGTRKHGNKYHDSKGQELEVMPICIEKKVVYHNAFSGAKTTVIENSSGIYDKHEYRRLELAEGDEKKIAKAIAKATEDVEKREQIAKEVKQVKSPVVPIETKTEVDYTTTVPFERLEADLHDSVMLNLLLFKEFKESGTINAKTIGILARYLSSQKFEQIVQYYESKQTA
jgi:hypothetical protein